jgi:hypothetical protein
MGCPLDTDGRKAEAMLGDERKTGQSGTLERESGIAAKAKGIGRD